MTSWGTVYGMGYIIENAETAIATITNRWAYSTAQSIGTVANFVVESGVNPTINQYGGGPGRGIAQWSAGARWDQCVAWCAANGYPSARTLPAQLAFFEDELRTSEHTAGGFLLRSTTPSDAAAAVQTYYERPANGDTTLRRRIGSALFAMYGGHVPLASDRGGVGYHAHHVLKLNDAGPDVMWLQARLAIPVQDSLYGPSTERYVKTFQQRYKLTIDGVAGPITLGRLGWTVD